ncbi:MAG: hypothetical protein RSD97_05855 [Lachnospiraceae bacterium]
MDNFRIIYKILKAFEKSIDAEEFNHDLIAADKEVYFHEELELVAIKSIVSGDIVTILRRNKAKREWIKNV